MAFPMEGAPGVLADLAAENGTLPFNYEYQKSYIRFNNYTNSNPMIFGGAGFNRSTGDLDNYNPDTNIYSSRNGVYGAGFQRVDQSNSVSGFRCVFPIE